MPLVGVVMGSKSDEPVVQETVKVLEELGVDYEVRVMSAHRTPERVREYAQEARNRGLEVLIAAAGGSAASRVCWPPGALCRSSASPWPAASCGDWMP